MLKLSEIVESVSDMFIYTMINGLFIDMFINIREEKEIN